MRLIPRACGLLVGSAWAVAAAQVPIETDGRWRHLLGAGASVASGNSDTASLNLSIDSARATLTDKWTAAARALYARSAGMTTGERLSLASQYNRDLNARWFAFGSGELLRDRPANLSSRASVASGAGYHLARDDDGFWDLTAGLGYARDRYVVATEVDGQTRTRYGRAELVLAEESRRQLSRSTAWQQKVGLQANLRDLGDYRAVLESNLAVAINSTLSLTVGLSYRYTADPGTGFERGDALFVTGVSYRVD